MVENTLNEKEKINVEIVEAFTFADIPLEKIEKLKPFLLKYCKNGIQFFIYFLFFFICILFYLIN